MIAIENVDAAINQIAQTTLRKVVGQPHPGRGALRNRRDQRQRPEDPRRGHPRMGCGSEPGRTQGYSVARQHERAMARQAEAEREKCAKIIAAEGESMAASALGPTWTSWRSPVNFTERGKTSEMSV